MAKNFEILKLNTSKEKKGVLKQIYETGIEILPNLIDTLSGLPLASSIKEIGKMAIGINDTMFIRKLDRFNNANEDISDEAKQDFIDNLDPNEYTRITTYLINLLISAEEEGKAELMGKIYKARIVRMIENNDDMLRLCSIVNKSFITDLNYLEDFIEESDNDSHIANNLYSLGLLRDCGNYSQVEKGGFVVPNFGPTKHKLNNLGHLLLTIIKEM